MAAIVVIFIDLRIGSSLLQKSEKVVLFFLGGFFISTGLIGVLFFSTPSSSELFFFSSAAVIFNLREALRGVEHSVGRGPRSAAAFLSLLLLLSANVSFVDEEEKKVAF